LYRDIDGYHQTKWLDVFLEILRLCENGFWTGGLTDDSKAECTHLHMRLPDDPMYRLFSGKTGLDVFLNTSPVLFTGFIPGASRAPKQ
jgi:hypothetical protein